MASQLDLFFVGVSSSTTVPRLLEAATDDDAAFFFGAGGGEETSKRLSALVGTDVPLLGKIAFNPELRTGGDDGVPLVQAAPESESAQTILAIAEILVKRSKSLVGVRLGISPESN